MATAAKPAIATLQTCIKNTTSGGCSTMSLEGTMNGTYVNSIRRKSSVCQVGGPSDYFSTRAVSAAGPLPYHHANRAVYRVSLAFASLASNPHVQRP